MKLHAAFIGVVHEGLPSAALHISAQDSVAPGSAPPVAAGLVLSQQGLM